jgi:hypothetical protein
MTCTQHEDTPNTVTQRLLGFDHIDGEIFLPRRSARLTGLSGRFTQALDQNSVGWSGGTAPSSCSIRRFVCTPPGAEKPCMLPSAASTR